MLLQLFKHPLIAMHKMSILKKLKCKSNVSGNVPLYL